MYLIGCRCNGVVVVVVGVFVVFAQCVQLRYVGCFNRDFFKLHVTARRLYSRFNLRYYLLHSVST